MILTMHCYLTRSAQLPRPVNTVSLEGNRVKIECSRNSSNLPVDWEFSSSGNSAFSDIYTVGQLTENLSSRYKVDIDNKTRYDIVIDSVDMSDAGTYRCTIFTNDATNPPSYSAQLIVLGKVVKLITACFYEVVWALYAYFNTASALLEVCKDSHKNLLCSTK